MSFLFGETKTPLTMAIDRACSEAASREDDGLVARLEICDIINEVEIGAKDSIKYLKKKLTTKAHPAVLVKTLLVLETCTKNCGRRFHLQLADRSFMDQLAKLVVGKNALGGLVRDRILGLIQAWTDAFRGDPELANVASTHQFLLSQGVEFPAVDADSIAPIMTPQASASSASGRAGVGFGASNGGGGGGRMTEDELMARELAAQFEREDAAAAAAAAAAASTSAPSQQLQQQQQQQQQPAANSTGPAQQHQQQPAAVQYRLEYQVQRIAAGQQVSCNPEQLGKIRGDLAVVEQNVGLLSDLLGTVEPAQRLQDSDLIPDISRTCRAMHERILILCEQVTNEDLISELLVLNDRLNEGLHAYDRRVALDPPAAAPVVAPSITDFSAFSNSPVPAGSVYPTLLPHASSQAPILAADLSDPLLGDLNVNPLFAPNAGTSPATTPSPPPPAAAYSSPHPPPAAAAAAATAVADGIASGGVAAVASYGGFDANGMPWLPPMEDQEAAVDDRELATDADLEAELAGTPPPAAATEPLLQFDSPTRPSAAAAAAPTAPALASLAIGGDLFDLSFAPIGNPSGSTTPASSTAAPPPSAVAAAAPSPSRGVATAVRALSDDRVRKMEALENDLFGL